MIMRGGVGMRITTVVCGLGLILILTAASVTVAGNSGSESIGLTVREVKDRHEGKLMSFKEVTGVGIGTCEGKPCIKVYVESLTPEIQGAIPSEIEGFQVRIEVTGEITAF